MGNNMTPDDLVSDIIQNFKKNKKQILKLESEIKRHRRLYYNGEPEISDADFDALKKQVLRLL